LNLVRLSGLAAVLGGALWTFRVVVEGSSAPEPDGFTNAWFFVVPLLLLASLVGTYALYRERLAALGQAGVTQGCIGLGFLTAGFLGDLALGIEGAGRVSSFGFLIFTLGMVLLGYAAVRSELFPRWNSLPLAIGIAVPLDILLGGVSWARVAVSVFFGLCWVLFGYLVWSDAKGADRA
jgi:hypothetical protein